MVFSENKIKYLYFWVFVIYFSNARPINAAFLDWIWSQSKDENLFIKSNGPLISVPFEYQTEDEKFLEEASKFTDLMKTSSLDLCQHKVILQIKTSCFSMSEEELAKMSVNLLNCQSQVDERKTFPCTESMSLKECTKDMDADMWNAYHLMNNRARAVCLAARRTQFQALSEMTVNKLMATAHDQISKMTSLLEGQEKLESLTIGTLDSVQKGHDELMEQQENLKTAQRTVQDFVKFNLEQLTQEKALIAAGNIELAKMTKTIKEKLDEANEQLIYQSEERSENHQKLIDDIEALQKQSREIFQRIDSSTDRLLAQHEMASLRYKDAVENLIKINDTVHYLLKIMNSTRREIDDRLFWIQDYLDGTGTNLERLSSITFHIAYLLIGMLFASFLNFSTTSRAALAAIVPLNLFVSYNKGAEMALNFSQMTIVLFFTVLAIAIIHQLQRFFSSGTPSREYIMNSSKTNGHINESSESPKHKIKPSNSIFNSSLQYLNRIYLKFNYSLNQLLSFMFGWVGKKSNRSCDTSSERHNDDLSKRVREEKIRKETADWDYFDRLRGNPREDYSHVHDWLHSRGNYSPRPGSTSSRGSGSPKNHCSAVCNTGLRCKNHASPGRDVCHRHLAGTSISSYR